MMAPEDVVSEFVGAIEHGDIDEALEHMAPECEYDNVPIGKAVGHEAIRAVLQMFVSPGAPVRFEVVRQVAQGNLIFNERIDHMTIGGSQIRLPVVGGGGKSTPRSTRSRFGAITST
jgi:limonene-1,2-epoxide hydrolase